MKDKGINRNISPGDSDISTKKGFLITLPNLKRKNDSVLKAPVEKAPIQAAKPFETKNDNNSIPKNNENKSRPFPPKPHNNFQNRNVQNPSSGNSNSAITPPANNGKGPNQTVQPTPVKPNTPQTQFPEKRNNKPQNNNSNFQNKGGKNRPQSPIKPLIPNENKRNDISSQAAQTQQQNRPQIQPQKQVQQQPQNRPQPQNRSQSQPQKQAQAQPQNRPQQPQAQKQGQQPQSRPQPQKQTQPQPQKQPSGQNSNTAAAFPPKNSFKQDFKVKKAPVKDKSDNASNNMPTVKLTGTSFADSVETQKIELERKYASAVPLAVAIEEENRKRKILLSPPTPYMGTLETDSTTASKSGSEETAESTSETSPVAEEKVEIVGIRFREAGKIYYFDPNGLKVAFGIAVIVETARGSEYGFCAIANRLVPVSNIVPPLKKIERLATPEDTRRHNDNKSLEEEAEKVFNEKSALHKLEMSLIYVEYTFDNSKLLFYFTAEGRVDFRELVKDLASIFRTRIELRQIGVRDEAKVLGGLGVCGRTLCCNTFLGEFMQVSIKMAKDQSLSLNSSKISGTCGRLMCCLRYEDDVYEQEGARTPKVDAIVETPEGKGVVIERNALKGIVKVHLSNKPDVHPKNFTREEVTVVGYIKRKDDVEEDLKALEKE